MDIINKWLKATEKREPFTPRPYLECKDGFSVSIQVGRGMYSDPRSEGAEIYSEVELGFPSGPVPDYVLEYAENPNTPEETVYSYVPVGVVEKLILLHGGPK